MFLPLIMMRMVGYQAGVDAIEIHGKVTAEEFEEASKDLEDLLRLIHPLAGDTQAKRRIPNLKRILELAKKLGNG